MAVALPLRLMASLQYRMFLLVPRHWQNVMIGWVKYLNINTQDEETFSQLTTHPLSTLCICMQENNNCPKLYLETIIFASCLKQKQRFLQKKHVLQKHIMLLKKACIKLFPMRSSTILAPYASSII